jgi:2-C-methyl-D-erythritol 4-phosphate cytidylyltransferase
MVAESKRQLDRYSEEFAGKSIKVVPGGATRQESVYLGLVELDNDPRPDYVLVHDAARPFITRELVERSVNGAIEYGAFSTGMPPADTIKRIEGSEIKETLDRSNLILVQTPQGGRFDWLLAAHKKAAIEGAATTDDAAILEAAGHRVSIIRGASFNLKITQPDDLVLAEALADIVCR